MLAFVTLSKLVKLVSKFLPYFAIAFPYNCHDACIISKTNYLTGPSNPSVISLNIIIIVIIIIIIIIMIIIIIK